MAAFDEFGPGQTAQAHSKRRAHLVGDINHRRGRNTETESQKTQDEPKHFLLPFLGDLLKFHCTKSIIAHFDTFVKSLAINLAKFSHFFKELIP